MKYRKCDDTPKDREMQQDIEATVWYCIPSIPKEKWSKEMQLDTEAGPLYCMALYWGKLPSLRKYFPDIFVEKQSRRKGYDKKA